MAKFGKDGDQMRGSGDFPAPHSAAHPVNTETRMLPGKLRQKAWEGQPKQGGGKHLKRGFGRARAR